MQKCEVKVDGVGTIRYYQNGKCHRLDGPAVEYSDGTKYWYQNGFLHRLDGPAIEFSNGSKSWFQNGKCHRLDGPAVEFQDGTKSWYIEGEKLTEEEFNRRIDPVQSSVKELTVAEISDLLGYDVKIIK